MHIIIHNCFHVTYNRIVQNSTLNLFCCMFVRVCVCVYRPYCNELSLICMHVYRLRSRSNSKTDLFISSYHIATLVHHFNSPLYFTRSACKNTMNWTKIYSCIWVRRKWICCKKNKLMIKLPFKSSCSSKPSGNCCLLRIKIP